MNNIKDINVSEPWFSLIQNGYKSIEGRLKKGTFASLKKKDIIRFKNNDKSFLCKIVNIVEYKTFEEYLSQEGLARTLPGTKTIHNGVQIYYQYYTKEQEKEFGILAIHIKLIK